MEFTRFQLYDLINRPGPLWLSGADLSSAMLVNIDLQSAKMNDVNLSDTDLSYSDLSGAILSWANLSNAKLLCSDLRCVILTGANLKGADLTMADLRGAWLYNVDFSVTKFMESTNVRNALYNKFTVWPNNFDPEKNGAVLKEEKNSRIRISYLNELRQMD